jgi:hypothetical protein
MEAGLYFVLDILLPHFIGVSFQIVARSGFKEIARVFKPSFIDQTPDFLQ